MNPLRQLLLSAGARAPLGTWIMSASPLVTEAMGHAGFQWGVIDMEHTPLDMMEVIHLLQAAGNTRMVPIVRVPWNDTVSIKRVLDAGANTLLIPFVQNVEEARRAASAITAITSGCRMLPAWPSAADRSPGPMNSESTPGTAAIASSCATAAGVSSCSTAPTVLLAVFA